MLVAAGRQIRLRAVALWCAMTVTAGGTALVAAPSVAGVRTILSDRPAFADLLVAGCAAAAMVAAAWLWVITTDVVVGVLRNDGAGVRRPGPVRLLLLATCGVVVLGATAAPASADDRHPVSPESLAGLPLPDRPTGDAALPPEPTSSVRVRPGDSLWTIAEERLGRQATVADVVDLWHRIYARNARAIGPDPDLILPGQLLELPPTD